MGLPDTLKPAVLAEILISSRGRTQDDTAYTQNN